MIIIIIIIHRTIDAGRGRHSELGDAFAVRIINNNNIDNINNIHDDDIAQ